MSRDRALPRPPRYTKREWAQMAYTAAYIRAHGDKMTVAQIDAAAEALALRQFPARDRLPTLGQLFGHDGSSSQRIATDTPTDAGGLDPPGMGP